MSDVPRDFDPYFGACPTCHRAEGRWMNVGNEHWIVCNEHKVKWSPGANIFSSWKDESPELHIKNRRDLEGYTEVKPYFDLSLIDTLSQPRMKRVIINFDRDGVPSYFAEEDAEVQVLVIDERAPRDRVYELTQRWPATTLDALVGDDPIGSRFDARHKAVEARILAHMDGKPHLTIVHDDGDERGS